MGQMCEMLYLTHSDWATAQPLGTGFVSQCWKSSMFSPQLGDWCFGLISLLSMVVEGTDRAGKDWS